MTTSLFTRYSAAIRNFTGDASSPELEIASDGALSVYYAPFEYVNPTARLVLVGITPGRTQAVNALTEAKLQLEHGANPEQALKRAKQTGAFSGAMRPNLTAMLDHIGLAKWLRVPSCEALFGDASKLLQTASVLPFPVFVNSENYNGTPDIVGTSFLRSLMVEYFAPSIKALPDAVFLPLGPVVAKAMAWLVSQGHLSASHVLSGLPHPSGANAERIQYFLGRKEVSKLSAKTDPAKLDEARTKLIAAIAMLRS